MNEAIKLAIEKGGWKSGQAWLDEMEVAEVSPEPAGAKPYRYATRILAGSW